MHSMGKVDKGAFHDAYINALHGAVSPRRAQ
jgi:hypothetical protein